MRNTRICLLFLFGLIPTLGMGQKESNIWYFGRNAGVTFNTDPPTAITNSKMTTMEGSSSIADSDGNLLFYTDGQKVWNRFHTVVPNGLGLNGDASSTHSSLIVKKPGNDSTYYIITADDWPEDNRGVSYSVMDMKLDSGRGDIREKNVLLVPKSAEKIAAVVHRNGIETWLAIPQAGTNSIAMFLVTETGIKLHHTIDDFYHSGYWNWGQIKFSPNSKLLALTYPESTTGSTATKIAIANFDNQTGLITNPRYLQGSQNIYGLEFSPNSSFLYFSTWLGSSSTSGIYQYDLNETNPLFNAACTRLTNAGKGQLQLAPNGKIYGTNDSFLSEINKPDLGGLSCDYNARAISLGGKSCWFGLPSFFGKYITPKRIFIDSNCYGNSIKIYIDKDSLMYDSAHWFVGNDTIPTSLFSFKHRFPASGYYSVKLILFRGLLSDTFDQEFFIKPNALISVNLSNVKLCEGDSAILNAFVEKDVHYSWSTGSIDSAIIVKQPGTYTVKLSKQYCLYTDTATVTLSPLPESGLPADTAFCDGGSLTLSIAPNVTECRWSTGDTAHIVTFHKPGLFTVKLSHDYCNKTDTVRIIQHQQPVVFLGNDTTVCDYEPFRLKATFPYSSYLWSTLATDSILTTHQTNTYWVTVSNTCGTATDTITVINKHCECALYTPNAFTPNNDLLNDFFIPRLNCPAQLFLFQVYDRWGQLLFESHTPNEGWSGQRDHSVVEPGTYIWVVSYALPNSFGSDDVIQKAGTVTLLR